jgi:hypothetical protein
MPNSYFIYISHACTFALSDVQAFKRTLLCKWKWQIDVKVKAFYSWESGNLWSSGGEPGGSTWNWRRQDGVQGRHSISTTDRASRVGGEPRINTSDMKQVQALGQYAYFLAFLELTQAHGTCFYFALFGVSKTWVWLHHWINACATGRPIFLAGLIFGVLKIWIWLRHWIVSCTGTIFLVGLRDSASI